MTKHFAQRQLLVVPVGPVLHSVALASTQESRCSWEATIVPYHV